MAGPTADAKSTRSFRAWLMPAGFGLAFVGLGVATYAYTPPRSYEFAYAGVALLGFLLMFGGIVVAGHARATGGRRKVGRRGADPAKARPTLVPQRATPVASAESAPKKRFALPFLARRGARAEGAEEHRALPFRARKRDAAPAVAAAAVAPVRERLSLRCPRCATTFVAEGVRPIALACPSCALTGTLGGEPGAPAPRAAEAAPALAAPRAPPAAEGAPGAERLTLACPRCAAKFVAVGTRPLDILCPSCGLTGKLQ